MKQRQLLQSTTTLQVKKRSKENLAQTLAAVDYKIDKTLKGSVPQPDDDWRTAVFKAAGKDDISSDKTLGKALAGKFGKSVASIQIKRNSRSW